MKRFLLLICLLPAMLGCAAQNDVLTVCSSLPLLGGSNARALSMSRAIQMAIDEQQSVTFMGHPYDLRYVALDDATEERGSWDPAQEERNARAAIAEHDCIAYIGTYNSGAAKISMPILNRARMLMISPGNTYPGLTKPDTGIGDEPWIYSPLGPDNRNYCRVVPADDLQAPAAARYAADVLGVTTAFIFHDTESYGRGLAELFAETASAEGIASLNGEPAAVGRNISVDSARQVAQQILNANPDLVYFGGTTNEAATTILRILRDEGYEGYFMGADGIAEDAFIDGASARADERLFATLVGLPPSQLDSEAGRAWYQAYRDRYGQEPDAFAAPSYEAARVVIRGLESAQGTLAPTEPDFLPRARPALLAAVKPLRDYQGILGTWSFDENCDTTSTTISLTQAQGGGFAFVTVIE